MPPTASLSPHHHADDSSLPPGLPNAPPHWSLVFLPACPARWHFRCTHSPHLKSVPTHISLPTLCICIHFLHTFLFSCPASLPVFAIPACSVWGWFLSIKPHFTLLLNLPLPFNLLILVNSLPLLRLIYKTMIKTMLNCALKITYKNYLH